MEIRQQIELIFQQLEQMFLQHLTFDFPFSFSWNGNLRFHLLLRLWPFLKFNITLCVTMRLFKLTWMFSWLLNIFIANPTWFDDNEKQRRNHYYCSHRDYAEGQIQEKHSKKQKWLKLKINYFVRHTLE